MTAQVRIAELAAQNPVTVLDPTLDLGPAIDGRARPAPANPAAMSAPTPVSTRRNGRVRRPRLVRFAMLELL